MKKNTSLDEIHKIFEKKHIHHLPVVENGKVKGIVTHTDYLQVVRNIFNNKHEEKKNQKLLTSMLAGDVMSTKIHSLRPTDTVADALRSFKENTHHSILVMEENGKLKGILTTHDLILRLERQLLEEAAMA